MCFSDSTAESDGTFTADCYCGWVEHGHPSQDAADRAADEHQNRVDVP